MNSRDFQIDSEVPRQGKLVRYNVADNDSGIEDAEAREITQQLSDDDLDLIPEEEGEFDVFQIDDISTESYSSSLPSLISDQSLDNEELLDEQMEAEKYQHPVRYEWLYEIAPSKGQEIQQKDQFSYKLMMGQKDTRHNNSAEQNYQLWLQSH
ncbi:hypothetical protein FOA43_002554 [Brettanomyces nanus]|uniref:Uncharacterized protein n=1 Tax=Eeniella nana TaxID=13502 RepID=A0A875S7S4_EENNA|nr:uncharacterized protein FOA43_002554 [Brettanomyces nanus]QPG75204.1 hypothetical protein FOA43_002554 [Brettanomyces nanus]